jgi:hypothetical protein
MSDLAVASHSQALEPLHTPSSADGLHAVEDGPEGPAMPVHDGSIPTDVPPNYVSDAELLAWLQTKSSGQYGELDQLMDTSNARSKLVKDLSNLKEKLANASAEPESAYAAVQEMRAAYAGTPQAAEVEALLAPFAEPLENYANAVAGLETLEMEQLSEEKAAEVKAGMRAELAKMLPKTGTIDSTIKDLEHDDQLALVQIQALMSEIRETAQLTSNIIANRSQTADSIVGNLRA